MRHSGSKRANCGWEARHDLSFLRTPSLPNTHTTLGATPLPNPPPQGGREPDERAYLTMHLGFVCMSLASCARRTGGRTPSPLAGEGWGEDSDGEAALGLRQQPASKLVRAMTALAALIRRDIRIALRVG